MILHPQLENDCFILGQLNLCILLLLNDKQYPWFILVPQREGIQEIHHLSSDEQNQLMHESCALSQALETCFKPNKLNIAALGNIVPQLHIHHIARFKQDIAWPQPVWGFAPAKPYNDEEKALLIQNITTHLPMLQAIKE
jgi:diadenosine tetraphosphate (Ap4A) HIT family hydrolase